MKTIHAGCILGLALLFFPGTVRSEDTSRIGASASNSYSCYRISETICVDGELKEACWSNKPVMLFKEIEHGTTPPYVYSARLLWDEKNLYIGYTLEETNVWGRVGWRDSECDKDFAKKAARSSQGLLQNDIMLCDMFVKLILDPDADGKKYIEYHVNPLNNLYASWCEQGFKKKWGDQERGFHYDDCPRIIRAVSVQGTLNAAHDKDQGWSVEIAIPWEGFKPFTKGNCPPYVGDIWSAHLGYVWRGSFKGERAYWTWPVIGQINCHLPDTYGRLIFCDNDRRLSTLIGWGGGAPEEIIPRAKSIGVTEFVATTQDASLLAKYIAAGKKEGVAIYSVVNLNIGPWNRLHTETPLPLQVMDAEENELLARLKNKDRRPELNYQWGGEPAGTNREVLVYDLLCFHDPRVREVLKKEIADLLKIPGLGGLAFDGFGYQNYQCCRCPLSMKLFEEYASRHKDLSPEQTVINFSLETLVSLNNELADYARSLNPAIKIANHIWPVFLPEPLYGRRLDIDYCGETAAWFFPWDMAKVRQYAGRIAGQENACYQRNHGVAMVGYYNHTKGFPIKSPVRIEEELNAILDGGCRRVLIAAIEDVLASSAVAEVFRRYSQQGP